MINDTALVEAVLLAASLPDSEVVDRVAAIGAGNVAQVLLAEVAARVALIPGPAIELPIRCDLGFGADRLGCALVLTGTGAAVKEGPAGEVVATLRQDLIDLLRELYGPAGPYGATREILLNESLNGIANRVAVVAVYRLTAAISPAGKDLNHLAVLFGSDKWGGHWYTPHYQRYFEPYREQPVRILEIGVGGYDHPNAGGESLRMWRNYFRRGLVYGLDIFVKTGHDDVRLKVLQGDQGDPQFLDSLARRYGPFDIVIDDGSHISGHILTSFKALFPHLRPGGMYVVEDLLTAYWPRWGGDDAPVAQYQTMEMIKSLLDDLHHQEQLRDGGYQPSMTELLVTGVHVHHNMAVIEKGLNTEQGGPERLRSQDHTLTYAGK